MKYRVISHVGIFWKGPDITLGTYRWLLVAKLRAWWHVRIENPWRAASVIPEPNDKELER